MIHFTKAFNCFFFLNHAQIKQLIIKFKIPGFDFPTATEMYINVAFLF